MSVAERIASLFGYQKAPVMAVGSGASILGIGGRNTASSPRPTQSNLSDSLSRYADEAWVYSCIRTIQTKAGGVPLKVYKVVNGKKTELPDHPLKKLLDSVNPFMDGVALQEATHGYKELGGNAIWLLDRMVDGRPTEIYPLNPAFVKPLVDKTQGLVGYEYRVNGILAGRYQPEEILHFRYWNPTDPFWGQPPISAGRDGADMLKSADQFNIAFFKNSAEAGGFLTTDKTLTQDNIDRIKAAWAKNHQGARKAHKVEILHGGLDFKTTTMNHRDMMFPEMKRMSREEVLTCYTMPPVMVGVFDEANYSNADIQREIFWKDCMLPRLRAVASVINERLAKPYDETIVVEHDTSGIDELQEDAKSKAERDSIHVTTGVKTINEVRAEMNLPKVTWGDTWNAPIGLMPIDAERPTFSPIPPADEDEPEEDPADDPEDDEDEEEEDASKEDDKGSSPAATVTKVTVDEAKKVRDVVWSRFKAQTEPRERRWYPVLRGLFNEQEREVIRNLKDQGFEGISRQVRLDGMKSFGQKVTVILFDRSEARKVFQKEGKKLIEFTLAAKAADEISDYGLGIDFEVSSPRVQAWIAEKSFKFADELNRTTEAALRKELEAAIEAGEAIADVEKRIEQVFDIARGPRTRTIARTEVISASNRGAFEAYDQSGVVSQVEWVSSRDSKVRDEHRIDGERVGIGQKFSNGLIHPGDPAGQPGNVINCRCTTAPVVRRDE